MQFAKTLLRLIHTINNFNLWGGPIFLSKIDLADAYKRVWISPEELLHIAFFVPLHAADEYNLMLI